MVYTVYTLFTLFTLFTPSLCSPSNPCGAQTAKYWTETFASEKKSSNDEKVLGEGCVVVFRSAGGLLNTGLMKSSRWVAI